VEKIEKNSYRIRVVYIMLKIQAYGTSYYRKMIIEILLQNKTDMTSREIASLIYKHGKRTVPKRTVCSSVDGTLSRMIRDKRFAWLRRNTNLNKGVFLYYIDEYNCDELGVAKTLCSFQKLHHNATTTDVY
tara:strand:- start:151 stop:543 length:393 start_codon:yes stop_codon:yes gene_type:complete